MVTIRQSGGLELYNTEIITTGTGYAVEFADLSAGAGITVGNGSVLYGKIGGYNADKSYFKTDCTAYFSHDISSVVNGGTVAKASIDMTVPYVKSTATKDNDRYVCTSSADTVSVKLSYVSRAAVKTSATQSHGYPWMLIDKDGKVTYSANLSPLAVPHSYVEVRLIESIDNASGETLWLTSDISINAECFITARDDLCGDLFVIRGTGNTVLGFSGAYLDTASLVYYRAVGELSVSNSSEISAARLVRADSAPILLRGGYWYTSEGVCAWTDGSVTVCDAVINGASTKISAAYAQPRAIVNSFAPLCISASR
jgi:hypothetical protein